jgi:miniconductance mechanosensitive channel
LISQAGKNSIIEKINSSGAELTNLGLFIHYLTAYVGNRDDIRKDFVNIVRQQQPTTEGLPLEVYAFCSKTNLIDYEKTQGEIFEHVFASVPLFGLNVFQKVSGDNLADAFRLYNK